MCDNGSGGAGGGGRPICGARGANCPTDLNTVATNPLTVRVRLLDYLGVPIALTPCDLEVGDSSFSAKSNANGVVEFANLPLAAPITGTLVMHLKNSFDFCMPMSIQDYADPDQSSGPGVGLAGARARLNNMGYMALGDGDSLTGPLDDNLKRGLQRFQNANQIFDPPAGATASGLLDGPTQDALRAAHDTERLPFVPRI